MAKAKTKKTENVAADNSAANVSGNIPEQAQVTTSEPENNEEKNISDNVPGNIPEQTQETAKETENNEEKNIPDNVPGNIPEQAKALMKQMGLSEIYENSRGEYFTRPDLALNSEAGNAANVKHYKA
ncbi:MAG: hypothetical protein IK032_07675 [Bacteroidales bacterium]|nr:hypothetical protein [Bacteroidales bacterium]MBR5028604.1 hypothetical protein [Bacteroidales bacterium]